MNFPHLLSQQASGWGSGPSMMGGYGMGFGMGWFGLLLMAVFWVAIIVGVVFLIRWLAVSAGVGGREAKQEDSAIEILRKRYAHGDINKDEFEEKKRDLT